MEHLQVLSLNGNGLRTTIAELSPNSSLRTLDLSHNRISGSIPESMKQFPCFDVLDLSYNLLGGTVEDASWYSVDSITRGLCNVSNDEPALKLVSNRISGNIPSSFVNVDGPIEILDGNMFSCDATGSNLPQNDPNRGSYFCGSSLVDGSMFGFTAIVGFCLIAALLCPIVLTSPDAVRIAVDDARTFVTSWAMSGSNSEVNNLDEVLGRYRYYLFLLMCIVWVVLGPFYLGMKSYSPYSTHTFLYGWIVSLGFMEDLVPATAVFMLWMVVLPLLVLVDIKISRDYRSLQVFRTESWAESKDSSDVARWKYRYLVVLIVVNVCIVVFVNGGYVFVVLTQTVAVQSVVIVLIAVFKTVWNLGVMNPWLPTLSSSKNLLVSVTVLNKILLPIIGTILVDIDCFQQLFIPSQPIGTENDLVVDKYFCAAPIYDAGNETSACLYSPTIAVAAAVVPTHAVAWARTQYTRRTRVM